MASEDMGLVPPQRLDSNGLTSQMVFQQEGLRFSSRPVADPSPKTRELSGFIDDRYFQSQGAAADFRRSLYVDDGNRLGQSLNGNGQGGGEGSEGDEEEEDDDDDEDDEEDDIEEREGGDTNSDRKCVGSVDRLLCCSNVMGCVLGNPLILWHIFLEVLHCSFGVEFVAVGSSRELMHSGNDNSNARPTVNGNHQQGRSNQYHNAVTIADANGDLYYSQYLHGLEGSGSGQKGVGVENGCGGSGRKEGSYSTESGESLRMILSDPLTGALMDDAIILPCGHSFGGGGVQQVLRNKACCTCSHPVSEESVSPNLSLRAAVQAFRREEELNVYRSSKRRRDRFEQDKGSYGDSMLIDHSRGRGVQFPFAVTDRVIIKEVDQGNKRTPPRFVGREAIVTTQCLNGWYVVKTLDNAESVKLQYRSLAKVSDDLSSSQPSTSKMSPNWL
ncbi:hypothetical protein RHSIM_Rhsim03G0152200 [Rhododendron simsii]|uniref:U-box domain-containing protein n=1 Tax=Rhododendron simsii TaxID=118357 RepID=A0A834H992_RHOSS|nr:hypothetical protein RHSIM_Rhsim03G0152200 [Rhododendron simsii]